METYLKTNVADYLTTKQNEWVNTLSQFTAKGNYNSTTTYSKWNVVLYNYESYVSKQNNNLNHSPIGDGSDLWWGKLASRGEKGEAGMGLTFVGDYNNSTSYSISHAVKYNNKIYYCKVATTGNLPTNTTYWTEFLSPTNAVIIQSTAPTTHSTNSVWIRPL
jgi:hypothetical protein